MQTQKGVPKTLLFCHFRLKSRQQLQIEQAPAESSSLMEIASCSGGTASSSSTRASDEFSFETDVSPSLSLTHTDVHKMPQMTPTWREREAGKARTQTLMKNKSLLNPT